MKDERLANDLMGEKERTRSVHRDVTFFIILEIKLYLFLYIYALWKGFFSCILEVIAIHVFLSNIVS